VIYNYIRYQKTAYQAPVLSDLQVFSACEYVPGEFGILLECIIDQESFWDREKGIAAIIFSASFRNPGEFAGDPYGE
jgi:hypothetical protein